jgi:hypothetical protein
MDKSKAAPTPVESGDLLTEAQVAERLGIRTGTLSQ